MNERLMKAARWVRNKIFKSYTLNNAQYWDRYVLLWKLSGKAKQYHHLGEEWKNEEVFLGLLQKYTSGRSTALEIGCGGGQNNCQSRGIFRTNSCGRCFPPHAATFSKGFREKWQNTISPNRRFHFKRIRRQQHRPRVFARCICSLLQFAGLSLFAGNQARAQTQWHNDYFIL